MHMIGEFKGVPTLTLKDKPDDRFGLTFGLGKAKMILDHIEVIKKFVEDNTAPDGSPKLGLRSKRG